MRNSPNKSFVKAFPAKIEIIGHFYTTGFFQKALFYSKLAILELCGWTEVSMDDIIRRHSKRILKEPQNWQYIEKEVIKRTYGFEYQVHFRRMLISIIGLTGVERLEKTVDPARLQPMIAALNSLKPYRDKEAHEYIKGTTRRLDAPSITRGRFIVIYEGLRNIDTVLRTMK